MTAWGTKLRPLLKGQCHLLSVTMKKIQNTGGGAGGPGSPATPQAKMFLPGQSPPGVLVPKTTVRRGPQTLTDVFGITRSYL